MRVPKRIKDTEGHFSRVDGIDFNMPIRCRETPVIMGVFPINAEKAAKLLVSSEVHPLRMWNKGMLVVTVINYQDTTIGKYIEYSIAIACTHGRKPAPRLLPLLFTNRYGTGQWVFDLPVSSEVSVKGGKGIWGMPKHQGSLNFKIGEKTISTQYDLDGRLAAYLEIGRPKNTSFKMKMTAANYCAFRGMLWKSYLHFTNKLGFCLGKKAVGRFVVGDHPRMQPLKDLEIEEKPMMTAYIPSATGILDDHIESWFLHYPEKAEAESAQMEGLESVVGLGVSQEWPPDPNAPIPPPKA